MPYALVAKIRRKESNIRKWLIASGQWASRSVICLLLALCSSAHAQVSEPQLRAGVIVGVLRYVKWQSPPATPTLPVCGMGDSPGFRVLLQSKPKITIGGRAVEFRELDGSNNGDGCAAVIVGANINGKGLAYLKKLALLSICDTCNFPDQHAIALFMSGQRIRFSADMALAQSAGVQFDAAMLELAAKVER